MKKILYVLTVVVLLTMVTFLMTSQVMALTLDTVNAEVSKTKIAPGEEVTVKVNFGKGLGAYTLDVAYDNAIFDYVRSEGGTQNDNGTRVRLVFYDSTGGSGARTDASVTFKAKESILTSNPTDFAITLEGMSNADASETYDDITTPIEKDVLVEPNYVDYSLNLQYTGSILVDEVKDMTLITASSMGKNYDHVRLIAQVTDKPSEDATAKLLATNEDDVEVDLIQNGWGEADGYALGGKDVKQELALRGEFNKTGKYSISIKLIDRDNSDAIIAQKTFDLTVVEEKQEEEPITTPEQNQPTTPETNKQENEMPTTLPKTGNTQYALIIGFIAILTVAYVALSKKNYQ